MGQTLDLRRVEPIKIPWVTEDIFFFSIYWSFAAKPRQRGAKRWEKKITSGHRSYESHFHAILGSYISSNRLELMCMFVFINSDSWDLIVRDSLRCRKKELPESLLRKESANHKNCHKFFSKKYTSSLKYMKRTEFSWEVHTLYVFRSKHIKRISGLRHLYYCTRSKLRNGKRAACNHGVMDARGRLLSTKEA